MTLRHKLADRISGGELTRLRRNNHAWEKACDKVWDRWMGLYSKLSDARRELEKLRGENENLSKAFDAGWGGVDRHAKDVRIIRAQNDALHQIIAQETPSANATVRRMARIAREALE